MTKKSASSAGAALVAFRKTAATSCVVCGKTFVARIGAKFCSNKCRQADKYQRLKAAKA